jgi:hypothetical protein
MPKVIDAVRHGSTKGILRKVMCIYHLGFLTPDLSRVLEVSDQLLLLRIHANDGMTGGLMGRSLSLQMLKLLVALRMLLPCRLFAVGSQTVALLAQQAANDGLTHVMTALLELLANVAQAAIEPSLVAHRVTCGLRSDNLKQDGYEGRVFFSAR